MPEQVVDRQVIYTGKKCRFEVHTLEAEDGSRRRQEVVVHNGAVVVLPFLDDQRIVMIRNRRATIGQTLLELPAGTLEKGEDPLNCAGRELLEETGYLAERIRPIGAFYSSPGLLTERMYAFAAYDLAKRVQQLEEDERIEVVEYTLDQAIAMIYDGVIVDGKTICTLLMYRTWGDR